MKTFSFLLAGFLFCSFTAKVNNTLNDEHITGKVKSITEYEFFIVKGKEVLYGKHVTSYDKNGNETLRRSYNAHDSINFPDLVWDYKYNEKGDKVEENIYNADGSLSWKTVFTYNISGLLIETNRYPESGILMQRDIFKYDSAGRRIEYRSYDGNGGKNGESFFRYDAQNRLIEEQEEDYAPSGYITKVSRKYDGQNNLAERLETEIRVVDNKEVQFPRSNYFRYSQYDDHSNWINMSEAISSRGITDTFVYRREISYY